MNYYQKSPKLKGKKVILRNIDPSQDNQLFYKMFLDPDIHLWTGNNIPQNEAETFELLCKYRDFEELISWSIINAKTHEFIGTYWIAPAYVDGKRIITDEAQRIAKNYWRKGYTKEARILIYDFAFFELNVEEIHARAWRDNSNSCKSMESIGFELFSSKKRLFSRYNKQMMENHYILTKQKWMNMKKKLLNEEIGL